MRSFVKISPSRNCEITLSFNNGGKSCPSREFLTTQIKFSQQFPNLQYSALCRVIRPLEILPLYNYNRSLNLCFDFRAPNAIFKTFYNLILAREFCRSQRKLRPYELYHAKQCIKYSKYHAEMP